MSASLLRVEADVGGDEELEREKRAKVPIEGLSLSAMVSEALEIEDNQ